MLPSSVPARGGQEARHADKAAELQKGHMENRGFGKGARDNTDPRAVAAGALALSPVWLPATEMFPEEPRL